MRNLAFFSIVLAFLGDISGRLSTQLRNDLQGLKVVLDDQTMEIKKEIQGGSIIDLLDGTSDRVTGINSFDKDRLKQGRAFIFDQIALNYATHATDSGLEGKIAYSAVPPKELQNAVLVISQNGREALRLPVRDVANIKTGLTSQDDYKQLKSLRYLLDDQEVKVQLHFPVGTSLDSAVKHYVYFRANGLQTAKKVD
jgi:hypothetical protein